MTYTPAQMRMLHRLAAQRGLDHDDLRAIAGVQSLTQITRELAAQLISRLDADRPEPARRRRYRRLPPGCIRMVTPYQRTRLAALLVQAAPPHPQSSMDNPQLALAWANAQLKGFWRQRIADVAHGAYSSATATAAITQLERYLAHSHGVQYGAQS